MTETLVVKTLSSPFYESPDMLISDVGNIITFNLISLKPFSADTSSEQDTNPFWLCLLLICPCWQHAYCNGKALISLLCSVRRFGKLPFFFVNYGLKITLSEMSESRSLKNKTKQDIKYC